MSTVVKLPPGLDDALTADLQRQKGRVMGLRSKLAKAAGMAMAERERLLGVINEAEVILRRMRLDRFPAEDAAIEAISKRNAGEFAPFAGSFTEAARLVSVTCSGP